MTLREKIERWMRDEEKTQKAVHWFLAGLSYAYGAGVKLREMLYTTGVLNSKKLSRPVISVGNLTVGGTGKTPMAVHLAGFLISEGKRPVILSRGYGGKARDITVVSDGENILSNPVEAGDEPVLMAERLPGVPVVVCRDRYRAGEYAIKRFSPDFIILDDGFQHMGLARDMDILLIDSYTGFGNGYMLPRGILREPLTAVRRADAIFIKGKGSAVPPEVTSLGNPVLKFEYRPASVVHVESGKKTEVKFLKGKSVSAVSAIADPASFHSTLKSCGATVVNTRTYPDHHSYTPDNIAVVNRSTGEAEIMVTTEKDAVKLKGHTHGMELYALRIDVKMDQRGLRKLFAPYLAVGEKTPGGKKPAKSTNGAVKAASAGSKRSSSNTIAKSSKNTGGRRSGKGTSKTGSKTAGKKKAKPALGKGVRKSSAGIDKKGGAGGDGR